MLWISSVIGSTQGFQFLEMIPSSRPQLVCLPCFSQSVAFPALQFQQSILGKFEWLFLENKLTVVHWKKHKSTTRWTVMKYMQNRSI